ncbi:MAG: dipeptide epimerase [Thaumarchaeota archaeon]|nr:dipeptide epimerase [Nitrososphaerota archaeon]
MRIAKIDIFEVDLPFRDDFVSRMNVTSAKNVVVKVVSDDGLVGYGSATPVPRYLGATQGTLKEALRFLGETVLGQNPFDLEKIHYMMDRALAFNTAPKAAIDMAVYDLLGKAVEAPVNSMLGGLFRNEFYTDFNLGMKYIDKPEEMARMAAKAVQEGFRAFEVKVATGLKNDISRVMAIREAVGDDVILVADANRAWNVKEAIESIRALQVFRNIIFEEPVGGVEAFREVREAVDAPICADETCHTVEDAEKLIRTRAADILCIKLMKCGGLLKAKKIATAAESAGIVCRVDGVPGESKLSNTASTHLALSLPNLMLSGSGVAQHHYTLRSDIGEGGLILDRGAARITDAPGLGFSVNDSMLKGST